MKKEANLMSLFFSFSIKKFPQRVYNTNIIKLILIKGEW